MTDSIDILRSYFQRTRLKYINLELRSFHDNLRKAGFNDETMNFLLNIWLKDEEWVKNENFTDVIINRLCKHIDQSL